MPATEQQSLIEYSAIVPCRNEAGNIPILVQQIDAALKKLTDKYEIIIVNDNSSDNSSEVLAGLEKTYQKLRHIDRRINPGVGYTKREGFASAKGKYIITMDGDLSHEPEEIPRFVALLDKYDLICGSRYVKTATAEMSFFREAISGVFNFFFRTLVGIPIKDMTSGFRVFKKEIVDNVHLKSTGFGIYVEIPMKAHLKGYRITEVPITHHKRIKGVSKLNFFKQGPEYVKVALEALVIKLHLKKNF
jgi:glycosyltransferase involved in cell wall biosynthesis